MATVALTEHQLWMLDKDTQRIDRLHKSNRQETIVLTASIGVAITLLPLIMADNYTDYLYAAIERVPRWLRLPLGVVTWLIGPAFLLAVLTAVYCLFSRRSTNAEIARTNASILETCGIRYFPTLNRNVITPHDVVKACQRATGTHGLTSHQLLAPLLIAHELGGRRFFLPDGSGEEVAVTLLPEE